MGIRGIDAQMMIIKSTVAVREASFLQKRAELTQEYLASSEKAKEAQEQSKVAKIGAMVMGSIRTDVNMAPIVGYKVELREWEKRKLKPYAAHQSFKPGRVSPEAQGGDSIDVLA